MRRRAERRDVLGRGRLVFGAGVGAVLGSVLWSGAAGTDPLAAGEAAGERRLWLHPSHGLRRGPFLTPTLLIPSQVLQAGSIIR